MEQDWEEIYAQLSTRQKRADLTPEDTAQLATAAYLTGRDGACTELWSKAHQGYLSCGEVRLAVRCAFWMATALFHRGEAARGSGWIARAERLLAQESDECVERGYLLLPSGMRHIKVGDAEGAYDAFSRAAAIAERFGDADLAALARHSRGRVLIRMGRIDDGVRLLDEAMVSVEAGEVSPIVAGDVYCSVIEGCLEIFDLRRAQEWTAALSEWCDAQPGMAAYRGQCLVRRSEIMQLHGMWPDALDEARQACDRLAAPPGEPAAGAAFYQTAQLHRLRGEYGEAEDAYRKASEWGRRPQPGLALLWLAQGQVEAAEAAIRQEVDGAGDRLTRARLLPAYVEIMLAAGDAQAAHAAAEELSRIAREIGTIYVSAVADTAAGEIRLAEGDARHAGPLLRHAWKQWMELEAPYEAARTRVLIGRACRDLGDEESAMMEFEAARAVFERLGAVPDVHRVEQEIGLRSTDPPRGLTPREMEVLRLLASGDTNRLIGDRLFISERTVERHVSSILAKLGVGTRAAATAFAYEHGLMD